MQFPVHTDILQTNQEVKAFNLYLLPWLQNYVNDDDKNDTIEAIHCLSLS